jgi:hypothetical protein
MKPYCLICKTKERILVRDHCHKTGYIRGVLCDKCNSWLGIYEKHILKARKLKSKHLRWIAEYQEEITKHLSRKTPFKYSSGPSLETVMQANLNAEGMSIIVTKFAPGENDMTQAKNKKKDLIIQDMLASIRIQGRIN